MTQNIIPILPEVFFSLGLLILILVDLFLSNIHKNIIHTLFQILLFSLFLIISITLYNFFDDSSKKLGEFLKLLIVSIVFLICLYSKTYIVNNVKKRRQLCQFCIALFWFSYCLSQSGLVFSF